MTPRAVHDLLILVEPEEIEKFQGRMVVSNLDKELANVFEVISTGPGIYNPHVDRHIPTAAKVGDFVFVHKVFIKEIKLGTDTYYVTNDANVLSIIDKDPENGD
jgi:co-chaperonin GroES (HSP10)